MPRPLLPALRTRARALLEEHGAKGTRYLAVSAFNVVLGQIMLAVFHGLVGFGMVAANLTSVAIGGVPAYLLSRYWVWEKSGKNHLWREVVPFWGLLLLGLAISTGLAALADRLSDSTLALMAASITGFGIVWVGKYFILDTILFRPEPDDPPAPPSPTR